MLGTPIVGDDRGGRLIGTTALKHDMAAGGLEGTFSGIANIDGGTAHSTETVLFSDLKVGPAGMQGFPCARGAQAVLPYPHSLDFPIGIATKSHWRRLGIAPTSNGVTRKPQGARP